MPCQAAFEWHRWNRSPQPKTALILALGLISLCSARSLPRLARCLDYNVVHKLQNSDICKTNAHIFRFVCVHQLLQQPSAEQLTTNSGFCNDNQVNASDCEARSRANAQQIDKALSTPCIMHIHGP